MERTFVLECGHQTILRISAFFRYIFKICFDFVFLTKCISAFRNVTGKCDSKKVKSEEYQATSSTEEVVRLEAENETIVDEGGWLLEQAMQAAIMNPEENTVVHINTAAESDATRINRDAIDEGGLLLEEAMQAARTQRGGHCLVICKFCPDKCYLFTICSLETEESIFNKRWHFQPTWFEPVANGQLISKELPPIVNAHFTPAIPFSTSLQRVEEELEEEEEDGDDLAEAETYADYVPAKLHYGRRHPHSVVESSTLSAVNPPEIRYTLNLPWEIIESGAISSVQLEAVVYACQRHESILPNKQRAGFLIGE
ncbi:hypothetical protein Aperf_G00000065210 [Anoplocephala perfoliata]